MIKTAQVTYAYPGQQEILFPDLACEQNEHILILGPSGVGKTTFLHLLGGILIPQKGTIQIGETNMNNLRGAALDKFRGRHIGIIFQKAHFVKSLSAIENLLLTQSMTGIKQDKERALNLLDKLSIRHKANSKTYNLSTGEQQRLAIARAVINKPDVILADEPSSALDDQNCKRMTNLLMEMSDQNNASMIIVTHDSRIKELFEKKIEL